MSKILSSFLEHSTLECRYCTVQLYCKVGLGAATAAAALAGANGHVLAMPAHLHCFVLHQALAHAPHASKASIVHFNRNKTRVIRAKFCRGAQLWYGSAWHGSRGVPVP